MSKVPILIENIYISNQLISIQLLKKHTLNPEITLLFINFMFKKPCLKFPKSATYIFWIENAPRPLELFRNFHPSQSMINKEEKKEKEEKEEKEEKKEKEEKEEKEEEWLESTSEGGSAGRHWGWHLVLHCTTVSAF